MDCEQYRVCRGVGETGESPEVTVVVFGWRLQDGTNAKAEGQDVGFGYGCGGGGSCKSQTGFEVCCGQLGGEKSQTSGMMLDVLK